MNASANTDADIGAFVAHGHFRHLGNPDGPLARISFGLKDLFDYEGVPTGAGNPDWLASHPVPDRSAPIVSMLRDAGAVIAGKTATDELAWSLNGENAHYGTPVNVAAPGRIPGGSSSGSAAAVAARLVDFAIGTDTGGSVRLPASYCGIYGLRPSHGRMPIEGAVPLAPSYDTVGWFARSPALMAAVGEVLLGPSGVPTATKRLLIADDLFERAEPASREALAPALARLSAMAGEVAHVVIAGDALAEWRDCFRVVQSSEAWAVHGAWVERVRPEFGPGIKERFEAASRLDPAEVAAMKQAREGIRARMEALVEPGTLMVLPTVPGVAPLLRTPEPELNQFRARAIEMLCPAGHAGMPQISLPLGEVDGCPVGLSLLAARGEDEALLDMALRLDA